MRRPWLCVLAPLCWAALPAALGAQDAAVFDRWRWVRQTLPSDAGPEGVWAMVEVSDTLVWVTTRTGVLRYDGYFWHPVPWDGPAPSRPPATLVPLRAGVAMIAHNSLFIIQGDTARYVPVRDSVSPYVVLGIAAPDPDTLLVLARVGPELRLLARSADGLLPLATPAPLGPEGVGRLVQGPWGDIWLNTTAGLYRREARGWALAFPAGAAPLRIAAVGAGRDGEAFVSFETWGGRAGLWHLPRQGAPRRLDAEGENPATAIAVGPDGVATVVYQTGDVRMRDMHGRWSTIERPPEGFRDIRFLAYRPDGNLWVGTGGPLWLFRRSARRWAQRAHPFPDARNRVHDILHAADGALWLATSDGVEVVAPDGSARWIRSANRRPLGTVTGLAQDHDGGIWLTSGSSFSGAWRVIGSRWQHVPFAGGGYGHRVTVDRAGTVWFAVLPSASAPGGAWRWQGGAVAERFAPATLPDAGVRAVAEAPDGSLWFAAADGVVRHRRGVWTRWDEWRGRRDTLRFRVPVHPYDITVDADGTAWFAERAWGLGRVREDSLAVMGGGDGLPNIEVWSVAAADSALWVGVHGGVGRFDGDTWSWLTPELGLANPWVWPVRPHGGHVHVGTLGAGSQELRLGERRDPAPRVRFAPPTVSGRMATVTWEAAAWWGHTPPDLLQTRWRLDGGDWSPWSAQRVVSLTSGGRQHIIEVEAKGLYGQRAEPASLRFEIPPPMALRPGFMIPVGGLSLGIVMLAAVAMRRKYRAAQLLRASEERFRHMTEQVGELILLLDAGGAIGYVSPAVRAILGWEPADMPGRSVFDFIHPDDLPVARARLQQALDHPGEPIHFELRGLHRDGRVLWVDVSGTSLLHDPSVRAVVVNLRDVTERTQWEGHLRESEAAYRGLVQHATHGILRSTPEGRFLSVNPALVQMFGYDSEDELLATPLTALYADPAERPALLERLTTDGRLGGVEVRARRKDGDLIIVRVSGRPVRHGDEVEAFEMIVEDVTEWRALELQLRQAQKMEAVGQLTAGIAHDFNNLLTAVLTNAELLSDELPAAMDAARDDLAEIRRAVLQAAALVRKLMAISRREHLTLKALDLGVILEETGEVLRRVLPEHIEVVMDRRHDVTVRADRGAVEQILLNLANNARDAMPDGGRLEFRLERVRREDLPPGLAPEAPVRQWAQLTVRDDGVGMDSVTRERVFEPFFTTKPAGEGTGLGLAMVYGLVQQLAGGIAVTSAPGQGTTVTVVLPAVRAPAERAPERDEDTAPRGGAECVLLVEDDDQIRRAARTAFERAGYTVLVAANGQAALQVLGTTSRAVDIVVADVVMPQMGGRELYRALRARGHRMPFIYVSGYTGTGQGRASEPLDPAVPLLRKPWTVRDLLATVRQVLDGTGVAG